MPIQRIISSIVLLLSLILITLAGLMQRGPFKVATQEEAGPIANGLLANGPLVIELEHDLDEMLTCGGCDNLRGPVGGSPLEFTRYTPLAVDINGNEAVTLFIQTDASVTSLEPELLNGESATVTSLGNNQYEVNFTHAQVTYGYLPEHNHSAFGSLKIYQDATLWGSWGLVMNVIDDNVPAVTPTDMAADVRVAPHLVNIYMPNVDPANYADYPAIAIRFYQLFPDAFDFLNIIFADQRIANRAHYVLANEVQGIGLSIFDYTAPYENVDKLVGLNLFPIHTYFDLAERAAVHEIGHQWINYVWEASNPHWPISSLAQGIMGFNIPGTNVGGNFPWTLTPDGNGNYWVGYDEELVNARGFTDLDLYLMGLLPPEAVEPEIIFQNQDQNDQLIGGGLLMGPVQEVDANTFIALHGPRIPAAANAPKSFRVASILVTRDRLLTAGEMAFFNYMAARGETTTPLPYQSGFATGETIPFYLATHCLATLNTQLMDSTQEMSSLTFGLDSSIYLPITFVSPCR